MSILYAKRDKMCGIDCRKFDHASCVFLRRIALFVQRGLEHVAIRDFMMRQHSFSTLFITAVHLQVLVCMIMHTGTWLRGDHSCKC